MPKPVRLHWGWVLAFQLLSRGLFAPIWLIVMSNWVRKVNGQSRAFVLSILALCALPGLILLGLIEGLVGAEPGTSSLLIGFGALVYAGLYLWATYQLRYELESKPISILLGGVATFFLGVIYFQYHLYDYDVEQKALPEGSLGLTS